jgi:YD repeat-containing protein
LKQVTRPDSTTISYKYDALGRRIQRSKSAGGSTNYIYDGEDVAKDINSDGSTVDYLNGLGVDDRLKQTSSSGTLYFTKDHLHSTRALTDSNGNVVESKRDLHTGLMQQLVTGARIPLNKYTEMIGLTVSSKS